MKKLILVICLIGTAGIAEASSKKNDHHYKSNGQVVQTLINTSFGVSQNRSGANLIQVVFVNNHKEKVYHALSRVILPVVHSQRHTKSVKKARNKRHYNNAQKHRSNVKYKHDYYK